MVILIIITSPPLRDHRLGRRQAARVAHLLRHLVGRLAFCCVYIYIYIYREREMFTDIVCVYLYLYIYIEREILYVYI